MRKLIFFICLLVMVVVPTFTCNARNDLANTGKSPPQETTYTTTPEAACVEIAMPEFTAITVAAEIAGIGEDTSYIMMTSEENPVATCQSIEATTTTSPSRNNTMAIIREQEFFLGPGLCTRLGISAERAQLSNNMKNMISSGTNTRLDAKHDIRGPGIKLVPAGCGGQHNGQHQHVAKNLAYSGLPILGPGYKSIWQLVF